jgi:hypothetical protein
MENLKCMVYPVTIDGNVHQIKTHIEQHVQLKLAQGWTLRAVTIGKATDSISTCYLTVVKKEKGDG